MREKIAEAIEVYWRHVRKLVLGEVSLNDLAITRILGIHPEDYLTCVRQATAAKSWRKDNSMPGNNLCDNSS